MDVWLKSGSLGRVSLNFVHTQTRWRRARMPNSTEGILITCDAAMRQYILHLDEQLQQDAAQGSFVLKDTQLDETHLLVKPWAEQYIREKIEELLNKNTFSREVEPPPEKRAMEEATKEDGPKKRGRGRKE